MAALHIGRSLPQDLELMKNPFITPNYPRIPLPSSQYVTTLLSTSETRPSNVSGSVTEISFI